MADISPFHEGERAVQMRAGQRERAAAIGRGIARAVIPGAWNFLAAQSLIAFGTSDEQGYPWPTLAIGPPGFVTTRDGLILSLDLSATTIHADDPLWSNVRRNGVLALLAIELATRRRLRVNGRVDISDADTDGRLRMTVEQCYANCPKYIQRRELSVQSLRGKARTIGTRPALSPEQIRSIAVADTAFVATAHPAHGADISHRGGRPGFVKVESPTRLRIPDYSGNSMFNTLGNIHTTGVAALLFIDFTTGKMLQIMGGAAIDWQAESAAVERSWSLSIQEVRESVLPGGINWRYLEASPMNP